ncbi:MAG: winged helix-turn-helix transcriptional regulator [Rhodobacterales bacterium]|nr:winged helix-turn-helix transcriptional regulator [Rhodobacterales bacterium]
MSLENWILALATRVRDGQAAADPDLSPSAQAVLLAVRHWAPVTVSELAAILAVRQPTVSNLVRGLEEAGLLARADRHGRQVPIIPTPAGTARADALQAAQRDQVADLLADLAPGERDTLGRLLHKVLARGTGSRAQARTTCRYCDHGLCRGADCPVGTRATELDGPFLRNP